MDKSRQRIRGTKDSACAEPTIPFIQINLHHSKSASAVLSKSMAEVQTGIALIQEPWIDAKGNVAGLGGCGQLFLAGTRVRTCIILKGMEGEAWPKHCHADLTTVTVKVKIGGGAETELVLASAYFPSDATEAPPPDEVRELIEECNSSGKELILGCDANAHHFIWGSSNCNNRGEELLEYIASTEMDFMNKGRVPTFRNSQREEVLDVTLASRGIGRSILRWRVAEEVSMSDHEQIRFELGNVKAKEQMWRNPRKTDWENYRKCLEARLPASTVRLGSSEELDDYCNKVQDALIGAFEANCRLKKKTLGKGAPWWNSNLESQRREVRKLLRNWKKRKGAAEREAYKAAQISYKKALETAKREGWKRYCDEINSIPEAARLNRILARPTAGTSGRIKTPSGGWAADSGEALTCLLQAHFPGLENTESTLRPDTDTEPSAQDWDVAEKVVTKNRVKWAIETFEPYKAPGADGVFPVLLQEGLDLLVDPLVIIYRACLALGYIPEIWRKAKVIFLPKPGRPIHEGVKDYRPISLTPFPLKTLERLVDRYIKDEAFKDSPLHHAQHAYREGKSVDSALSDATNKIKKGMKNRGMVLAAFLDVEGAFNFTTEKSVCQGAQRHGVPRTLVRWIRSSLKNRIIEAHWGTSTGGGRATRGCPQGGVLSPTLWSLVVDELLKRLNDLGIYAQAYADDILILVMSDDEHILGELMRLALGVVVKWCREVDLSVNPNKTELVVFTSRYKVKEIGPIRLLGKELTISKEAKYLGVTFDSRLNWAKHLENKKANFIATFWACRRAFGATWGLKPKMLKWIYTAILRPRLLHGAIAWWPRSKLKTGSATLDRLQGMVMRGITGARRSTPLKVLEMALDLPPLEVMVRAAAFKAAVRSNKGRPRSEDTDLVRDLDLDQEWSFDSQPKRFFFEKGFKVGIPNRAEGDTSGAEGEHWYTDGSKDEKGVGAGAWLRGSNRELVFALDTHATVFQAEVRAIRGCVEAMLEEEWANRKVTIHSDSRAAIASLGKVEVTSREVSLCREALEKLAEVCEVELRWVPGHSGILGNEKADRLAKRGAAGLRATRVNTAVPLCAVDERLRNWIKSEHLIRWKNSQGCRQAKLFLGEEAPKKWTRKLIDLPRTTIRSFVGWMTGHCELEYFKRKIGRVAEGSCRLCGEEEETPIHLLCLCPRVLRGRHRVSGEYLLKPEGIREMSLGEILSLMGYIKGTMVGG